MKMSTKVGKWISVGRYIIRAPLKFLSRARDLYVKSFTDCSTNVPVDHYATAGFMGFPPSSSSEFSKYLSHISNVNSSESKKSDDFGNLIRVASSASSTTVGRKTDQSKLLRENDQSKQSNFVPPRSRSRVAVYGRIDENETYDDDLSAEDIQLIPGHRVFPRSRSHAISTRSRAFRTSF
ncbi:OLC1v1011426C1 [Oldenlandia corymbosa var. corymbosa]|uniref:OLC1v1011426C1 n=1 Tax=Oldenlandia corymbosa var. corymbosa TaxID=529605 RepID=A0AAV1DTJ8_OLDCO|nr:OLC1v1011426C1 [Oldenlandia corymbosa var. corymbosa]